MERVEKRFAEPQAETLSFRVLFMGRGVGFDTFKEQHFTEEKVYDETNGVVFHPSSLATSSGKIGLDFLDAGQEKVGEQIGLSLKIQGVMVVNDYCPRMTYKTVPAMPFKFLSRKVARGGIPEVLCNFKVDVNNSEVIGKQLGFCREKCVSHFEISALDEDGFEKPLLYLARELTGDQNLYFLSSSAHAHLLDEADVASRSQ